MKTRQQILQSFNRFIGLGTNRTSHLEKWVSGMGGLVSILAVTLISHQVLSVQEAAMVVTSMGASAVLLFAVPHGPLSQPWPLVGGHVISAIIGVSCARWIPDLAVASALAVGLAIGAMHYLRCIHPPGGATALTAVIAGPGMTSLGYQYVLTPVLLNALVMLCIAIVFNYAFSWRRYPAAMATAAAKQSPSHSVEALPGLAENDLEMALQAMDSTIDISGRDLAEIYRLAQEKKNEAAIKPDLLKPGSYYSNGLYGKDWQVRQIIDMPVPMKALSDLLIYKVVAGKNRRQTNTSSFAEFSEWASNEVYLNENSWQKTELSNGMPEPD